MLSQYNFIDTDKYIITTSYTLYVNNQPKALKNYIMCKIMQAAQLELSYLTCLDILQKGINYDKSKATH